MGVCVCCQVSVVVVVLVSLGRAQDRQLRKRTAAFTATSIQRRESELKECSGLCVLLVPVRHLMCVLVAFTS